MADDLDDEWWTGDNDVAENDDKKDSAPADTGVKEKRGVKRPAPSGDASLEESGTAAQTQVKDQPKTPAGKKRKKKKDGRGKFVRKKITGEDDENLKKAGVPEDIRKLLKASVATSKSVSDDDSDEENLSLESDFFPANDQLSSDEYLKEVLPGWQKVVKKAKLTPGSPLILIICSSAIRAVQLNREIKSFLGKDCKTAKLFAKHMKLEEQKKFLLKKVCHASIGTPNRVQALLEADSLKLDKLHAIVLDWNWRDIKLKRMVDIPDVRRDLTLFLKEFAMDKVKQSPCRLAVL